MLLIGLSPTFLMMNPELSVLQNLVHPLETRDHIEDQAVITSAGLVVLEDAELDILDAATIAASMKIALSTDNVQ
jgi:hypothetical protein